MAQALEISFELPSQPHSNHRQAPFPYVVALMKTLKWKYPEKLSICCKEAFVAPVSIGGRDQDLVRIPMNGVFRVS